VNLSHEAKIIVQSNASLKEEITGFKEQNKEYKSEIENVTSILGQMKNIAGAIKETATNIGIDEKIINKNAKVIKESLGQMETANGELVQTSKQFATIVTDVTSQKGNIDTFIKKIADFADMDVQVIAFKKVLNEIEEVTRKLSERVSSIQSNFDGKLDGMNLSFGSLEKDFTGLLLKIDGVEKALEKIASRAQKVLNKSQNTPLPSE
jgi:chromosome segregation ATPase